MERKKSVGEIDYFYGSEGIEINLCIRLFKSMGQPCVTACLDCVTCSIKKGERGSETIDSVNRLTCPEHEPYLREFIHPSLLAEYVSCSV